MKRDPKIQQPEDKKLLEAELKRLKESKEQDDFKNKEISLKINILHSLLNQSNVFCKQYVHLFGLFFNDLNNPIYQAIRRHSIHSVRLVREGFKKEVESKIKEINILIKGHPYIPNEHKLKSSNLDKKQGIELLCRVREQQFLNAIQSYFICVNSEDKANKLRAIHTIYIKYDGLLGNGVIDLFKKGINLGLIPKISRTENLSIRITLKIESLDSEVSTLRPLASKGGCCNQALKYFTKKRQKIAALSKLNSYIVDRDVKYYKDQPQELSKKYLKEFNEISAWDVLDGETEKLFDEARKLLPGLPEIKTSLLSFWSSSASRADTGSFVQLSTSQEDIVMLDNNSWTASRRCV